MPFVVSHTQAADFDTMSSYSNTNGGDLCSNSLTQVWPVASNKHTERRYAWSLARQRKMLDDPQVRCMKVTDEDSSDIVATSAWHVYNDGPPAGPTATLGYSDKKSEKTTDEYPEGLPTELWNQVINTLYSERRDWMLQRKIWVLTQLQTRKSWRRKGAGTLLIKWGLNQAENEGCPVYLEGAPEAIGLYEKCGFRRAGGEVRISREPFDMDGEIVFVRMVADHWLR